MKYKIKGQVLTIIKEKSDMYFKNESHLLYHVKNLLNKNGFDLIKKRMWKDGHLVSDTQQYLRERKPKKKKCMIVMDYHYSIRSSSELLNKNGQVEFAIFNNALI